MASVGNGTEESGGGEEVTGGRAPGVRAAVGRPLPARRRELRSAGIPVAHLPRAAACRRAGARRAASRAAGSSRGRPGRRRGEEPLGVGESCPGGGAAGSPFRRCFYRSVLFFLVSFCFLLSQSLPLPRPPAATPAPRQRRAAPSEFAAPPLRCAFLPVAGGRCDRRASAARLRRAPGGQRRSPPRPGRSGRRGRVARQASAPGWSGRARFLFRGVCHGRAGRLCVGQSCSWM